MTNLKYRPDIDGLRALAILLVVGYHALPDFVPGGFVGVDVFFVISGYLITLVVSHELAQNQFSLRRFYGRRIRRLFPALVATTGTGWCLGWWVLWPDEFARLGRHLAAGNGFVANLLLWREAGYFDPESLSKPFLHLWSLGIEEQFYLLWPLILLVLWPRRRSLPFLTAGLTLLSLLAVGLAGNRSAAALFYLPIFRGWELMLGCLLATAAAAPACPRPSGTRWPNLRAGLGLGAIILAAATLDRTARFPGLAALLPTVGTGLLLTAHRAGFNRRVLASRPLVWLGLLSYPWYLWHWVLIAYGHIVGWGATTQVIGIVGVSLILAALTYRLVEQPLRRRPIQQVVPGLFIASSSLLVLGLATAQHKIPPRQHSPALRAATAAATDWSFPDGLNATVRAGLPAYVKEGSGGTVLFWGDSHVEQYAPRIVKLITDDPAHTKSAVFMTLGGCPPLPHVWTPGDPQCSDATRDRVAAYAHSAAVDAVVIGFTADYFLQHRLPGSKSTHYHFRDDNQDVVFARGGAELALDAFSAMLTDLAAQKPVYVIIDNPLGEEFDPRTRFQAARLGREPAPSRTHHPYGVEQAAVRHQLLAIAAQAHAEVIDLPRFLCEQDLCQSALPDGTPIYKDASHLRPFFVRDFLRILDVTVRRALAAPIDKKRVQ